MTPESVTNRPRDLRQARRRPFNWAVAGWVLAGLFASMFAYSLVVIDQQGRNLDMMQRMTDGR